MGRAGKGSHSHGRSLSSKISIYINNSDKTIRKLFSYFLVKIFEFKIQAALINALWDLWARLEGKPVWKVTSKSDISKVEKKYFSW